MASETGLSLKTFNCVLIKFYSENFVRARVHEIKETARNAPHDAPRNIFIQSRTGEISDEQRLALPSYSSIQRMVERGRELPEKTLVDKIDVHEIVIQGIYAQDNNQNPFLLYDSRTDDLEGEEEPVFLIWVKSNLFHLII